jgi:hypothetical protein
VVTLIDRSGGQINHGSRVDEPESVQEPACEQERKKPDCKQKESEKQFLKIENLPGQDGGHETAPSEQRTPLSPRRHRLSLLLVCLVL